MTVQSPTYTYRVFDPDEFPNLIDELAKKVRAIQEVFPEIDTLMGVGNSGSPVVGALAYKLGMPFLIVRKRLDTNHDSRMVNGWLGGKGILFIDDLIASGSTISKAYEQVRRVGGPRLYGALLYDGAYGNRCSWVDREKWYSTSSVSDLQHPLYIWGLSANDINIHPPTCSTETGSTAAVALHALDGSRMVSEALLGRALKEVAAIKKEEALRREAEKANVRSDQADAAKFYYYRPVKMESEPIRWNFYPDKMPSLKPAAVFGPGWPKGNALMFFGPPRKNVIIDDLTRPALPDIDIDVTEATKDLLKGPS